MYRAKENGRNNYQFFDQEMHARARLRLELERDLSGALERGEFSVHYQPLANVSSSQAVRFEALLRWQHPRLGPISPAVFIPLLEDLGHIVPVGEWVLDQACAQLRQWQLKYDPELRVAVNVSARQFDDPEMVAKVERALRAADLAPQSLELEVTEGMLMRDIEDAGRTLRRLDALGVHIAIDDFGTGYSQLVYLAKFPIHVLKVDRSVVETIGQPEGDRLVAAVIRMGQTLGLEVVAEGVEQESQLAFLRREHCDVFQGYLMSRPMAAADCERWLAQARQRNAA
jgi:EAL domain-containing protein (putative c-di-GMP-specific phosphodiesterase class I)